MLPLRTGSTMTGRARLGSNPLAPAPGPGPPAGDCEPGAGAAVVRLDHQYHPPAAIAMTTRIATIQRHAELLRGTSYEGAISRSTGGGGVVRGGGGLIV